METRKQAHNEIEKIFRNILTKKGMALREGQIELCHEMYDALNNGKIALCDAGVGIGKTYAYLVASALFQKYNQHRKKIMPILLSTASIALQNAILNEYIPYLSKTLYEAEIIKEPFMAVLRKGKAHYVCDARLTERLIRANMDKKNTKNREALLSMRGQIDLDRVEHLSAYDKNQICVPPVCGCALFTCRYKQFVKESMSPHYLFQVCNHNYLIADAIHRQKEFQPLLPDYCAVIIDEAHRFPETSRQMFGDSITVSDMSLLIDGLKMERFILASEKIADAFEPIIKDAKRKTDSDSSYYLNEIRKKRIKKVCMQLASTMRMLRSEISQPLMNRLQEAQDFFLLLDRGALNRVVYVLKDKTGEVSIVAAVPEAGVRLANVLWKKHLPIVLTSGTLAVGGNFSRFQEEMGLFPFKQRLATSITPSPFDYARSCRLYLPTKGLYPAGDRYHEELADMILRLIRTAHGHTLILFTAYSDMSAVYTQIKHIADYPIYVMRRNDPISSEAFRTSGNGVLFATGAAWEGLDFPGDMVSLLVVVRLPFPLPSPMSDYAKRKYPSLKEFLQNVVVPDMQIKLKQGFGRAIRTESDTCVIAILDERARPGRRYHDAVLATLPEMPIVSELCAVKDFLCSVKGSGFFENKL